jgi:hypothetical protein
MVLVLKTVSLVSSCRFLISICLAITWIESLSKSGFFDNNWLLFLRTRQVEDSFLQSSGLPVYKAEWLLQLRISIKPNAA